MNDAAGKRACVIGAGFGGLALAIRLQAAGVATTLIEARELPGGQAYQWRREGFTFDAGPTAIVAPAGLAELWALTGHDIAGDFELLPISPFCRFNWPDGTLFDYSDDARSLRVEVARLSPADIAGFEQFLAYSAGVREESFGHLGARAGLGVRSILDAAPALVRHQAWRSLDSVLARFIENEKLRQALSFHTLLVGGNPFTMSALHAQYHKLAQDAGVWCARGGTNRLAAGLARHFERIGGELRLADPAARIHTLGTQATEVETQGGWRGRFNAVASNADVVHSYRDLLRQSPRGPQMARKLARKRFSPSVFVVHFGIEGSWPGIPHHTVLFGPRWEGLLCDIHDHGVLPRDLTIHLTHPTVTDPSLAPEGKSVFQAVVPVAHLGKLAIDWSEVGPVLEKRVLDEVARRLIPDLSDRLVTKFHYTPHDVAGDLNAHLGSAFSLEPIPSQSAWFRVRNRDAVIGNFYLVGAATHPGAGIPAVLDSARTAAGLMLEDLSQ
jgi:phytoene desaturase